MSEIGDKVKELGGAAALGSGKPEEDAGFGGRVQQFDRGRIYWHPATGAHVVMGGILQKYLAAGGAGLDSAGNRVFGFPVTDELDAGFGGRYQVFETARIYWHPSTQAHIVLGGILSLYLAHDESVSGPLAGGPGEQSAGVRRFGFPTTDEEWTSDGLHRVSRFEWGVIFWRELAAPIFGAFYPAWSAQGGELGKLGYPISEIAPIAGGRAQHYQRGCLLDTGGGSPLVLHYVGPMLGQPALVAPDAAQVDLALYAADVIDSAQHLPDLAACFEGRLFLREVVPAGRAPTEIPLTIVANGGAVHGRPSAPLRDRALHDLCFRRPDGAVATIAAHAVYAKADWARFGVVHVTDTHLARRNDHIPEQFEAGGGAPLSAYNNFNDNFRDFVRYVNRLHDAGALDLVWATGDLVDYLFEPGDSEKGPGNFGLVEDLVLGRSPYPRRADAVEALRAPIFTGLGNHDYRKHPYPLAFSIDILDVTTHDVLQYGQFNISHDEAHQLWGADLQVTATPGAPAAVIESWKLISPSEAAGFVEVDDGMKAKVAFYFRAINRDGNYLVRPGIHRFAMLDSRWDAGITTSVGEVLWVKFFGGSKAQESFLGNGPPSVGLEPGDVEVARRAVGEAIEGSIVVLGIHAPLFDIENHEYAHYFRETEHARTTADEIRSFGYAYLPFPSAVTPPLFSTLELDARIASWLTVGEDFFKKGSRDPLLDSNVSLGQGDELLDLCLGGGGRPVDLVLQGHVHHNAECGLGRDPSDGHRYFHDYYTENPAAYYPSMQRDGWVYQRQEVRVRIGEVASAEGPQQVSEPGFTPYQEVVVPPYGDTLDTVEARHQDLGSWWHDHRPLLLQTAALGPLEHTQQVEDHQKPRPTFQGFRVLLVENNLISKVFNVLASDIEDPTRPLPWEPLRVADAPLRVNTIKRPR